MLNFTGVEYVPKLEEPSNDTSGYATHLVYLTSADNPKEIRHKYVQHSWQQNQNLIQKIFTGLCM
jgi:hypothetical protein